MYTPLDVLDREVIHNREEWLKTLGVDIDQTTRIGITYDEPNFLRYRQLSDTDKATGMRNDIDEPADAFIVTKPGRALFLPIADCVATVLYDEEQSVLMLSHLGRHSLEQQGGLRSVKYLQKNFGSKPENIKIWLSPAPSKEIYPIFSLGNKGMKEVVYEQLAQAGIPPENITDNPADTATDPQYYSHTAFLKGDKPTDGRFAMLAVILPK